MDGHPASSKWGLFETFAQNIIEFAQSNPEQWAETAIFVTVDEGGGFYDSGFIQPVDFFGTGPRIPMIPFHPFRLAATSATRIGPLWHVLARRIPPRCPPPALLDWERAKEAAFFDAAGFGFDAAKGEPQGRVLCCQESAKAGRVPLGLAMPLSQ
jgi:hypothetical protein